MMTPDERAERAGGDALAMVKNHTARLAEHFDTVHIFVSKNGLTGPDATFACQWGSGHWYARYGQIREWVVKEEAVFRREVTRKRDDS